MAEVLTLHRLKQAVIVAIAATMLFASGMMIQSTRADPEVTPEELDGFFLSALQIDFICTNPYTTHDRLALSIPLSAILSSTYSNNSSANNGQGLCVQFERLRISLSLNPYALNGYLSNP